MNIFSINHKSKKADLPCILLVCFMVVIILPLLIGTCYALPSADDFSGAASNQNAMQDSNIFVVACRFAKDFYMDWQGTFTSAFLGALLLPMNVKAWAIMGVRLFLCVNVLFLTVGVLWYGSLTAKHMFGISNRVNKRIFLLTLIFISFGICRGVTEVFYWYSGAVAYILPISLVFCCFALYMQYLWEKRTKKMVILLCILAFFASGGVLQATAIHCYGMLILWFLYLYVHRNKDGILAGLPFLTAFAGALVNVVAPGNYIRHARLAEGIYVGQALREAGEFVCLEMHKVLRERLVLYVILCCFLFGLFMASRLELKIRKYHPLLLFLVFLAGLVISIFPVCLGYGMLSIEPRQEYLFDLFVGWGGIICAIELGGWLAIEKKYSVSKEGILLVFLCIMFIFCKTGDYGKLDDEASGKTFSQLCKGDIQRCSETWIKVLYEIENSKEDKVVVQVQVADSPDTIIRLPCLSEDETNWVNQSIAGYYGKETVAAQYLGEQQK